MKHKICSYIFKVGKKKNEQCCKNGFTSKFGNVCNTHYKIMSNIEIKKLNINDNTEWTIEMELFKKNNTIVTIKNLLREKKLKLTGNKDTLIMRLFN